MEILACGVRDFCVGRRKRYRLAVSPVRYIHYVKRSGGEREVGGRRKQVESLEKQRWQLCVPNRKTCLGCGDSGTQSQGPWEVTRGTTSHHNWTAPSEHQYLSATSPTSVYRWGRGETAQLRPISNHSPRFCQPISSPGSIKVTVRRRGGWTVVYPPFPRGVVVGQTQVSLIALITSRLIKKQQTHNERYERHLCVSRDDTSVKRVF